MTQSNQAPFSNLLELWQDTLRPALQEWRAMTAEERQEWENKCPPHLKNGITFFLTTRLYGAPPDTSQG